jgi:hypothetical protein
VEDNKLECDIQPLGQKFVRATEFIIERRVQMPSIKDQILMAVKKNGGSIDDYFVRFTDKDKLGYSKKQWFPYVQDVDHPDFDIDKVSNKTGRRALWFYPLKLALDDTRTLYASDSPYVWLIKINDNAWLQKVERGDNKIQEPPKGKERVGMLRMSSVPAAIFFKPAYKLIGKYYDYASQHKRHGQVKGPPTPPPKQTLWQKIKDKILTEVPLPPDWDPEQMNLRQTFKDRLKYALDRAKRLGGGSSRVAMTIDYEGRPTALKVAKNIKGLAQNEAEIEILKDGYAGKLPIVIPLIDYDKANKRPVWLQTEIAKKVKGDTLLKLLHAPNMWLLTNQVRNIAGKKLPHDMDDERIKGFYFQTKPAVNPLFNPSNEWKPTKQDWNIFRQYCEELAELVMSSTLEIGDLSNPANWGVYNNRPVVIDLGFTEETAPLYGYNRK